MKQEQPKYLFRIQLTATPQANIACGVLVPTIEPSVSLPTHLLITTLDRRKWGPAEIPDYGVIPVVAVHFSLPRAILGFFGTLAETIIMESLTRPVRRWPSRSPMLPRMSMPCSLTHLPGSRVVRRGLHLRLWRSEDCPRDCAHSCSMVLGTNMW